jgi:UDP-2,3-diacylglucosamine pyrophosphatase LpxH
MAWTFFVSDLHLGVRQTLEDFHADEAFVALAGAIPAIDPAARLVLLGDTFDLWQAYADGELASARRREDCRYDAAEEERKLRLVLERHPEWTAALRRLAAEREVTVVPGNHDHSLVSPQVQQALSAAVGAPLRVSSGHYDPQARLYAEHSNQFDANNSYRRFDELDWEGEARGYWFVRLFWNRLELADPDLDNAPRGWPVVLHYLARVGNFALLGKAIRYFGHYWFDAGLRGDEKIVLPGGGRAERRARGPGAPAEPAHHGAPDLLFSDDAEGPDVFSTDPATEELLRRAYRLSPDVRAAVDEVLARKPATRGRARRVPPPRTLPRAARGARRGDVAPSTLAAEPYGGAAEADQAEDVGWAQRVLRGEAHFRECITGDPDALAHVVFGHTHGERYVELEEGRFYLNTGTWSGRARRGLHPVVACSGERAWLAFFGVRDGAAHWEAPEASRPEPPPPLPELEGGG